MGTHRHIHTDSVTTLTFGEWVVICVSGIVVLALWTIHKTEIAAGQLA